MAKPPLSSGGEVQSDDKAFTRDPSVNVDSGCVENAPLSFLFPDVYSLKTILLQTVSTEIS